MHQKVNKKLNISTNQDVAANEVLSPKFNDRYVRVVLLDGIARDRTALPDSATGNWMQQAVGIMDCPVTKALAT